MYPRPHPCPGGGLRRSTGRSGDCRFETGRLPRASLSDQGRSRRHRPAPWATTSARWPRGPRPSGSHSETPARCAARTSTRAPLRCPGSAVPWWDHCPEVQSQLIVLLQVNGLSELETEKKVLLGVDHPQALDVQVVSISCVVVPGRDLFPVVLRVDVDACELHGVAVYGGRTSPSSGLFFIPPVPPHPPAMMRRRARTTTAHRRMDIGGIGVWKISGN